MLNDSKWINIGETVFELRTDNNTLIATLAYYEVTNEWIIDFENIFKDLCGEVLFVVAKTNDEAKWKATVEIHNYCNRLISNVMRIRDHLPDLGELYDNAFDCNYNLKQ